MKTKSRSTMILALVAVLLVSLCACGNSHHAAVYNDSAAEWINDAFATANLTGGIYMEGADTVTDAEIYPRSRAFVVDTQETYDEIFRSDTNLAVDFASEMLVVCTFTSTYVRPVEIVKIRQDGETLSVTLKEKQQSDFFFAVRVGAACQPYQRYVVLKMDKLDVSDVELTIKN